MNNNEAFLCTHRSVRNMAFQGLTATRGNIDQLLTINGSKLVGTKIRAPFALNPEVYVLPMDNVLATKVHRRLSVMEFHLPTYTLGHRRRHLCPIRLSR
jgi:hypothetical protein